MLGELNLLIKTKEAELTLESLKESRRTLATRQSKLEAKLADADQNNAFHHTLKSEIANVAADIDIRSEQINELNQKIAAADLDNKAKTRLDYLQTMIEAKVTFNIFLLIILLQKRLALISFKIYFKGCHEDFAGRICGRTRGKLLAKLRN